MIRLRYHPFQRAALLAVVCAVSVTGHRPSFMATGAPIPAPRGLAAMCRHATADCNDSKLTPVVNRSAPRTGPDKLALLTKVNHYVNAHVRQTSDDKKFGEAELWVPSGTGKSAAGDCEDIALEKRNQLLEQGYPKQELFLAVAYTREIGLHAVLVARTETGDLVLDNRSPYLEPWDRTGYSWVGRQAAPPLLQWSGVVRTVLG